MFISKVREDGVFDGLVEVPDGTTKIPPGYSFSLPPEISEGFYAVMRAGWRLVEGEKPVWPPLPTPEEIYTDIVNATQKRLDDFAKTRNYDGILSACTYATSSIQKFKTEGEYCVQIRDATWVELYQILEEVQTQVRPIPSGFSEIESELPILEWPNTGI